MIPASEYHPLNVLRHCVQKAIAKGAPVYVEKRLYGRICWSGGSTQDIPDTEPLPAHTDDDAPIYYLVRDVHGNEYTMCARCAETCRRAQGRDEVGPGAIEPMSINGYPFYESASAEQCETCGDDIEPRHRLGGDGDE